MRADVLILGGWTLLVAVEGLVALLFEPLPALLLGWAALTGAALLAYVWIRRPAPGAGSGANARFVLDVSPQTVLLAVGLAALVTAVYAGYWLALVAGGMVGLAAWNLRREGR